jgi:precorrin-3B synthase
MTAPTRRGWCPGLSTPMPTGDGLLVRLLPADRMSVASFIALCRAARRHGNGTIEISARGSLQMRGFTEKTAPAFARDVQVLGLPAAEGVPIITDPLPEDTSCLVDATKLASVLRADIVRADLALGPKVSIVIDGGGRLHLDTIGADLRLRALATKAGLRLLVAIAGDARSAIALGLIPPVEVSQLVVRLLSVIAQEGPAARAHDCIRELREAASERCRREPYELRSRLPSEPIGLHALREKRLAFGVAPAFGHAHVTAFAELAGIAGEHGASSLRPAAGRALLLIGIARADAYALARKARRLGFIVRADDPRRSIVACPGSPACASGLIPARTLAAELAPHLRDLRGTMHVSGCAKGCAHPAAAALTIVGTEHGCGIVREGTARTVPSRYVAPSDLINEFMVHD